MDIEKQVCNLEQAKRLKELGIVNNTPSFCWNCIMPDPIGENWYYTPLYTFEDPGTLHEFICPAFTVAELSVMLGDLEGIVSFNRESNKWHGEYNDALLPTEAEAKAALLIKFLESEDQHVNPKVVNERLSS